jgi:hypothetical protein
MTLSESADDAMNPNFEGLTHSLRIHRYSHGRIQQPFREIAQCVQKAEKSAFVRGIPSESWWGMPVRGARDRRARAVHISFTSGWNPTTHGQISDRSRHLLI